MTDTLDVKIDVHPRDVTRMTIDAGYQAAARVKDIPGARYDRELATWTIPLTWQAALETGHLARGLRARVSPSKAMVEWAALVTDQAKMLGRLAVDTTPNGHGGGLFAHQSSGAKWLAADTPDFPGRMLLDETGSGKTRTVITALGDVDEWPVLVVCPNSVKDSWAREFAAVRPDLDVVVVRGTAAARRKALLQKAHVYVINFESVRTHSRLVAYPGQTLTDAQKIEKPEELNRVWPVVIADEAHRMKNPKAKVTQAMWGVGRLAERRWALTGTPVANTPGDLWALLRWIDPQAWPVRTSWTDYYCETEIDWFGVMRVTGLKPETNEVWVRGWRPVNRRILKESVLDLPPLLRGGSLVRHVELTPVQLRAYRQMAEEMVTAVRNGTVTVPNALVRTGRLMTLASAYAEIVGEGEDAAFQVALPSNKIAAFIEDWEAGDFPGPTVVATHSRQLLSLLAATLREAGHDRDIAMIHGGIEEAVRSKEIARFQTGEVPLFLMTYGVGGTGITLTAAQRMVLLQRSWSAVDMKQAVDRVHRIGSERHSTVEIVDYLSPGTVEVGQMTRLSEKEGALQEVVKDADTLARLLKGEL